ncbi:MAG: RuvA terminal domain, partial [Actinomycetota bacterium]|nr:RuvA terminal domain [Actinomycetota bacterium]
MISFLEGEVADRSASGVVLNVGGVGYDILAPTSVIASLPAVGRTARIHT